MMTQVIIIFVLVLFLAIFLGFPTAYALGIVTLIFIFIERGFDFSSALVAIPVVKAVDNFTLLAVPFFILVGKLMNESGLTERLFGFALKFVGHLSGGLAHVNILASMIFAGMSGAAMADAGGLGAIEYKAMKEEGYEPKFSAGVTLGSALIGPIIPPSIPVLIYASLTEISATGLLMAGLLPGILMGIVLMIIVCIYAVKRHYPKKPRASIREMLNAFRRAFLTLLTPVLLVGGIASGIFTATEASAIASLYLLLIVLFVYRTVGLKKLNYVFRAVIRDTATVMFLLAMAMFYGWMLTRMRIPAAILESLLNISENPYIVVFMVIVFLLLLGCFLSPGVSVLIIAPIIAPIGVTLGFHPLHFGIIVLIAMEIGTSTPPVGASLYALTQVTGVPIETISKGVIPFILGVLGVIILVLFIPKIALFVPGLIN